MKLEPNVSTKDSFKKYWTHEPIKTQNNDLSQIIYNEIISTIFKVGTRIRFLIAIGRLVTAGWNTPMCLPRRSGWQHGATKVP